MGIRSDVGVALKKHLVDALTEEQKTAWFGDCRSKYTHAEGTLYHWEHVKWYVEHYDEIKDLYTWLRSQPREDYLVVAVCHDYPESDDGNIGGWNENPWNLYRVVSVSLNIEVDLESD